MLTNSFLFRPVELKGNIKSIVLWRGDGFIERDNGDAETSRTCVSNSKQKLVFLTKEEKGLSGGFKEKR